MAATVVSTASATGLANTNTSLAVPRPDPAPAFGDVRLEPDLDAIEALASERESLWRRVQAADFLTPAEKRAAVGYPPEAPEPGA